MQYEDSFEQGAISLVTQGVNQVLYTSGKRYINCAEMVLYDPDNEPVTVRVTLVTEPVVFGETVFPPKEDRQFTTSVVEQLEQMERANERDLP